MQKMIKINEIGFYYDDLRTPIIVDKNKETLLFLQEDYSTIILKIHFRKNKPVFSFSKYLDFQKIEVAKISKSEYQIISNEGEM